MSLMIGNHGKLEPVTSGAKHRNTHRASVISILGTEAPPVLSKGSRFYNADRWTLRLLVGVMCGWAGRNNGVAPCEDDIRRWVAEANLTDFNDKDREIVIASTPDVLSNKMVMALVGGAYHEALHTKYTCRRNLTTPEISDIVIKRWPLVKDWSLHTKDILEWSNIIEDIRIERRGCMEYGGIHSRMCDLHDFVLGEQDKLMSKSRPSTMDIIKLSFRDLGKGYDTDVQEQAYATYREFNRDAFEMVRNGPLSEIVWESANGIHDDVLGSFRLAMDVLGKLSALSDDSPAANAPPPVATSDDPGEGDESDESDETDQRDDSTTEWEGVARSAMSGEHTDIYIDVGDALSDGVNSAIDSNDKMVEPGESPWRPYDTSGDTASFVRPSHQGKDHDTAEVDKILAGVRSEMAYLRSRMRSLVRSIEMTGTARGVRFGRKLSSRYIVDTVLSINSGEKPLRAFDRKGSAIDMSMACAVVVDESGSMKIHKESTSRIIMSIVEPLDALNAPTLVVGFRDSKSKKDAPAVVSDGKYHRYKSVTYDIFKNFDERFKAVRWRFANTIADGGTPMSDGIQFAMDAMSVRKESHRFVFVITDGKPNHWHIPVIRHQIRLAGESGVHVIGVGIGGGATYVNEIFPHFVWSDDKANFPKLLISMLNEFVDVQATKRGMMIKNTSV